MKIESEKADLSEPKFDDVNLPSSDLRNINMSGRSFDDLHMSGWRVHDANLACLRVDQANLAGACIVHARQDRARIDGIAPTALLAYWRAGHGAKSA